jgi:hypothetical protein
MGLLRPVFGFGIAAHLLERNQTRPGKVYIKREPLLGFPAGVADLIDLGLSEGFPVTLGRGCHADQQ